MSDTTLHILNRGPNQTELLQHCLDAMTSGDALLLIEDGVYWSTAHFTEKLSGVDLYVLTADLEARGLKEPRGQSVDDDEFVDLTVVHSRSVSWC